MKGFLDEQTNSKFEESKELDKLTELRNQIIGAANIQTEEYKDTNYEGLELPRNK